MENIDIIVDELSKGCVFPKPPHAIEVLVTYSSMSNYKIKATLSSKAINILVTLPGLAKMWMLSGIIQASHVSLMVFNDINGMLMDWECVKAQLHSLVKDVGSHDHQTVISSVEAFTTRWSI